jgi:phosphoribosylanthranilate isomerase
VARYGRTRVCVYAVRMEEEAIAAAEAGVDAVGFVFNPKSSKFIEPEEAWDIAALMPPLVATIGIFEDASVEKFSEIEERCPTDYTQLHGDESEEVVRQCGTRAIKTVRFSAGNLEQQMQRWDAIDEVDAVLVAMDAQAIVHPGALESVGAAARGLIKPVLIGGGVTAANVKRVIDTVGPWALVVSAGVEDEEGDKSPVLMREFMKAVRSADV